MGSYKKIPVVTNKLRAKKKQKTGRLANFKWVGIILAIFLSYMWVSVKTNSFKKEIGVLEKELKIKIGENQELRGTVEQLSDFGRINKIAQKELGLIFLSNEDIVEIK